MNGAFRLAVTGMVLALLAGCATTRDRYGSKNLDAIEAELRAHVDVLASDDFGGRRPGSEGERKTLRYLAEYWEAAGLVSATNDPANPWLSPLELSVRRPKDSTVSFSREGRELGFDSAQVRVFSSGQQALLADAPLVFVGRLGAELDRSVLAGRVAVMMWDHREREDQRAALLANGAAAVLAIVVSPDEYRQLIRFRDAGTYRLVNDDAGSTLDGYMSLDGASAIMGQEQALDLLKSAESADFRPVPLGINADLQASSTGGALRTHNLIAKLPGSNPDAGAVLLMAHWDHFGFCGDPDSGDTVCNGAVDNASGLAVLNAVASRLGQGPQLDRDVYFVATTAEEWGLLGATAFARNPPLPLKSIVAAFNLDSVGVAKRGTAVAIVGEGLTPLDTEVEQVIAAAGRSKADGAFAQQFVRRQDGWALLQRDIPTLMVSSAFGDPEAYRDYADNRYHSASDNLETVELGAASEDTVLHVDLVRHFASIASHPGSAR